MAHINPRSGPIKTMVWRTPGRAPGQVCRRHEEKVRLYHNLVTLESSLCSVKFPCPPKSRGDHLIAGSSLWWVGIVTVFLGNAWSLGRNYLACAWQLHKSKAVGCFPLPSKRLRACQSGGLGRMGKIRGLGKHMTHSPRAVSSSQPSPACGSGLCQQQKNNTLPKRLGTMKV